MRKKHGDRRWPDVTWNPRPLPDPEIETGYVLMPDVQLAIQTGRGQLMTLAIQRVKDQDEMSTGEAIEVLRLLGDLIDDVQKLKLKLKLAEQSQRSAHEYAMKVQGELAKLIRELTPDRENE